MNHELLRSFDARKASNGKLLSVAVLEGNDELIVETWDAHDRREIVEHVLMPRPLTLEDCRLRDAFRGQAIRNARHLACAGQLA